MPSADTMPQITQISVVILGSGLGGLTLGRCLRKKGISSVIYERASSAPRHTYGITLESWAYRPLLKVLDMDEHVFRRRIAVDNLYHGRTGKPIAGEPTTCDENGESSFRACRNKLESILREEQTVNLEHSISSASLPDNGNKVELTFQNGMKIRPTLVVDLMGVHSQLRKSLLPDLPPNVLPYAVYSSKRYLKPNLFQSTYTTSFGDGNCIILAPQRPNDPRLEITINDHLANGDVSISYIYSRAARSGGTSDPLHNPDRPVAGATDIPEEFFEELETFVNERKIDQPFCDAFDVEQIRTERLLHWLMRTILVPEADLLRLLKHGIVMIGDSAHATPILGGRGANFAISDAVELAEVIGESGNEKEPIEIYYRDHWQTWSTEQEASKQRIVEMHSTSKTSL